MGKISIEDLEKITRRMRKATILREGAGRAKVTVHMGTCGIAAGARAIMNALIDEFEKQNIEDVILTNSGCAGLCSREPMITVEVKGDAPIKYVDLTPDRVREVLAKHVIGGEVVMEYALVMGSEKTS